MQKSSVRGRVAACFFAGCLLTGLVSGLICPDRVYSSHEKRMLAKFPVISFSEFTSGKLSASLEAYLADQFPARDDWVTVKTLAERALGKRESGGVYFAADGYLIEKFVSFDQAQFQKNVSAVAAFADSLAASGIPVRTMLVPTASEILSARLPAFAPRINQADLIQTAAEHLPGLVDVREALLRHADEPIFYRTDHHFTSLGAYECYCVWKAAKGETADPLSAWQSEILTSRFRGTTYAKVNDPFAAYDTITAYVKTLRHHVVYQGGAMESNSIFARDKLTSSDPYAVFLNGNQASTVVSGGGNGRLLIVKDSYANTFAQFVVDEYEETHLIDLRFFHASVSDYVREHGITEVLVLYNLPNFTSDKDAGSLR